MADPSWSDAGASFPPAGPPTAATPFGKILAEIPDPNVDFQPEATIREWFTDGVREFAFQVFANALAATGKQRLPRDHSLLKQYLKETAALTMTVDTPDVALPTDCHLMLDGVLYLGQADEVIATEIPWKWDFRARTFPSQYGPSVGRPLVALKSQGGARFYLSGKVLAGTVYGFRYLRLPRGVYDSGGQIYKVDCPAEWLRGPVSYTVARWNASREVDPGPYLAEFQAAVERCFPAPKAAA